MYVEYHHKISPSKWEMEIFEERTQTFKIEGLGIEISLANLYDKVAFDSPN